MIYSKTACVSETPILKTNKVALIHTKGQITVRLTAIFELNISMARTGTEHIIQRFFPSKDKDADVVEVIVTNMAMTNGSTRCNI